MPARRQFRRLRPAQTYLYLLCYAWLRYRQLTDNLVDAFAYHMKQVEDACSAAAKQSFDTAQHWVQQEAPQVGRVLSLFVDETVADATPFEDVRQRAYTIIPREALQSVARRMSMKEASKLVRHWLAVDGLAERIHRQVRPLYGVLDVASVHHGKGSVVD